MTIYIDIIWTLKLPCIKQQHTFGLMVYIGQQLYIILTESLVGSSYLAPYSKNSFGNIIIDMAIVNVSYGTDIL